MIHETSTAAWLRDLSTIPESVPDLDVDSLPDNPGALLLERLKLALAAGVVAPQAMTLATGDADRVTARTVILKDVSAASVSFATHADSPKVEQLTRQPNVACVFFWPEIGEQLRIEGVAADRGDEESARDFLDRGPHSRASALVGRPSQPLESREIHAAEFAAELAATIADPEYVDPSWRAYRVDITRAELWHSSRAGQVRVQYLPTPAPVPTPAGPSPLAAWSRSLLRP